MHALDSKPIRLFREMFGDRLVADDYMEFYSNRRKGTTDTFLRLDIYKADKIATVIVESYGVRGKLAGDVITLFPDPGWPVPVFMFQLGGNARESIALLDISPTLPGLDLGPVQPLFAKYRPLFNAEKPSVEWVRSISSPCLLDCVYAPLDQDLFLEATREYFGVWLRHYYEPAQRLTDPADIEATTRSILRYKQVLHDGDPAHGIFSKAWGRRVADAFMYLETRDHPALELPG